MDSSIFPSFLSLSASLRKSGNELRIFVVSVLRKTASIICLDCCCCQPKAIPPAAMIAEKAIAIAIFRLWMRSRIDYSTN
jgi:hypothetical protein